MPVTYSVTSPAAIIAIDPGKHGAIAIQRYDTVTAYPLPLVGEERDLGAIASLVREANPALAAVEKVHAMHGQCVPILVKRFNRRKKYV